MKEQPTEGARYFWLDSRETDGIFDYTWGDDCTDVTLFANKCVWLKEEDALLAAKAIKELLTGQ